MKEIINFLNDNVIGKMLYTDELVYSLEDGRLEGVYSDQITFGNLQQSTFGFSFDMFVIASEYIYIKKNGKRGALERDLSGVSAFRFDLGLRKSTGKLTGSFRMFSATQKNQTAQGVVSAVYEMEIKGKELSWKEKQALYRDQVSADGYKAVAFDAECRIYLENEKLIFEYKAKCYDVDNFVRIENKDIFPYFIAKER